MVRNYAVVVLYCSCLDIFEFAWCHLVVLSVLMVIMYNGCELLMEKALLVKSSRAYISCGHVSSKSVNTMK